MKLEQKTMEDVYKIAKIAVDNNMSFSWRDKASNSLSYNSGIEINKTITPSQMYRQFAMKLRGKGIEVNEHNFNDLKQFVTQLKESEKTLE